MLDLEQEDDDVQVEGHAEEVHDRRALLFGEVDGLDRTVPGKERTNIRASMGNVSVYGRRWRWKAEHVSTSKHLPSHLPTTQTRKDHIRIFVRGKENATGRLEGDEAEEDDVGGLADASGGEDSAADGESVEHERYPKEKKGHTEKKKGNV